MGSRRSQAPMTQQSSPTIFPETREKVKAQRPSGSDIVKDDAEKAKSHEHRIDIGDEQSDLLEFEVFSGKLFHDKKYRTVHNEQTVPEATAAAFDEAKLTRKALIWGSHMLGLEDVISVSYTVGVRCFTVHSYPVIKWKHGLSCFFKPKRSRKDLRFCSSTSEEAIQWVKAFADLHFFVNCLPHLMVSKKEPAAEIAVFEPLYDEPTIKCRIPPKVLIILNPCSGRGRSSKVFHGKVEAIFQLAGFEMDVVKTTSAGHARKLASNVDFTSCPDGIICVGGDGIVNEVLNGLLSRTDQKEAISIPIGIIPAGSDNSLIWTVLGIRDPISAALAIVKGGLTAMDILAVEWIQTGRIHFGTTVSYFGFLSDVLELSEKYQKHCGPLRYFAAGFLKFLCLPKYNFELEYLPTSKVLLEAQGKALDDQDKVELSDLYTDIMRKSSREGLPRASSLSSIDSGFSPSKTSGVDLEATGGSIPASIEPSEYVRGLDPKLKRLSIGRNNLAEEPEEVLHPQHHLSTTPNWPRTRSKSRTDKGWSGLPAGNTSRFSWAPTAVYDKEDNSSTISDPGPLWDSEPKWDSEPNWEPNNLIQLPDQSQNVETPFEEPVPKAEVKWEVKKGKFLAVLVCNHSCKTVQSLSSQVVAPKAQIDDNSLDLLLIHGHGRIRLMRFFWRLQFCRLPFVEYVKVKSVKVRPGKKSHAACGIDGELLPVNGQVLCSLLPEQCRLIGNPSRCSI
ncbi:sphingoid long-chain bases kinase 1-like [Phalaenopsis equestris]|uniref:sphingoid long-chain bases kinase 1-like n=1 Tax=Phalaenopsis equestris TaxID=78828 RepID=UPI0009E539D4|nr:sphingoid long-chain bases kinase 1-like [Phalaenopsis equestris]